MKKTRPHQKSANVKTQPSTPTLSVSWVTKYKQYKQTSQRQLCCLVSYLTHYFFWKFLWLNNPSGPRHPRFLTLHDHTQAWITWDYSTSQSPAGSLALNSLATKSEGLKMKTFQIHGLFAGQCIIPPVNSVLLIRPVRTGGADKSLARHTSLCILFDGENISFDASLALYI